MVRASICRATSSSTARRFLLGSEKPEEGQGPPSDPLEAPARPPVDEPSDPIRFLSRADLGEAIADHPAPPPSELPFATLSEGSALPFPSKPPQEADWGLNEVSGVPVGLPKLLADEPPSEVLEEVGPPPAPPPPSDLAAEPEPGEELPDDVFALGDEEDELPDEPSEEWTAEVSEEIESRPPEAAQLSPAEELAQLRDEVAALQTRVWLAAIGGALISGTVVALLLLSL